MSSDPGRAPPPAQVAPRQSKRRRSYSRGANTSAAAKAASHGPRGTGVVPAGAAHRRADFPGVKRVNQGKRRPRLGGGDAGGDTVGRVIEAGPRHQDEVKVAVRAVTHHPVERVDSAVSYGPVSREANKQGAPQRRPTYSQLHRSPAGRHCVSYARTDHAAVGSADFHRRGEIPWP